MGRFASSSLYALSLAFSFFFASVSFAQSAEIVSLIGTGDTKEKASDDWKVASMKQKVQGGWFVRTRSESQMALLFSDRTQLRLQQNSQLQIKTVADQHDWQQTSIALQKGRAWSQARPVARGGDTPSGKTPLAMETPAVTLAIRGTDWDVEVGPDGRTQVVVLSGIVEVANAQGQIRVGPGEGAAAEVGKAPVRIFLTNPRARVQWVTAYRPQPRRWVPSPDTAASRVIELIDGGHGVEAAQALGKLSIDALSGSLLHADMLLADGDPDAAIRLLAPHALAGEGNPMASALLARALMLANRAEEAGPLLQRALQTHSENIEVHLAAADYAVFEGDESSARTHYSFVVKHAPERYEGWLGLGRIELERENVSAARRWLEQAAQAAPHASEPRAEMATLLSFAGYLDESRQLFDHLLAAHPDDYLALTGRGITRLKAGDPQGGLDDFLRAGVIEPRFARAWLYSGVAFYQLGDAKRALQAFNKAAELDPRDPLPEIMISIVSADEMALGEAVAAARRGESLMPYLKSLNQVLNNQKGHASLGSPLAAFNLEEWATQLAAEAYSPFWAGSYLFLADRQIGSFNKNSELFKGFLADPIVFGASNRRSSIVASPGTYGSIDTTVTRADLALDEVVTTVNGLAVDRVPTAYFLSATGIEGYSRIDDFSVGSHTITAGLGIRPRHDIGVFGFAKDSRIDANITSMQGGLNSALMVQDDNQADVGINYKISATQQIWVKVGEGQQQTRISGGYFSPDTERALDTLFQTNVFLPGGQLDPYVTELDHSGMQFRHAFALGSTLEAQWGGEGGEQKKHVVTGIAFPPAQLSLDQSHRVKTQLLWGGLRWKHDESLILLGEFHAIHVESNTREQQNLVVTGLPAMSLASIASDDSLSEINPRFGLRWSFAPRQALRLALQSWRRPAGISTLAPIETLGITVNDRLVSAGGLYRRARLQYETEPSDRLFLLGFVDHERVRNLLTPAAALISDAELLELNDLRNQRPLFGGAADDYEGAPAFGEGRVSSAGMAANALLSNSASVAIRYVHSNGMNTGAGYAGLALPYIPRHTLRSSLQLLLPQRWAVQISANWRSARFKDEINSEPLRMGWVFGAGVHWESADKRWLFEARADNLRSDKEASKDRLASISAKLGYRF